ncbi:hypothetical protein [Bosea sp. 124]|uniref:hypothetical protein n=1 Tax=Bosea sp. 124 TaxID=2135642 RepID=UPI000D3C9596|nr:hypothetical protein [Bosea sp. 124]PTM38588.1 hypothetical protein C8D03_0060 [Bosea sp. 124]
MFRKLTLMAVAAAALLSVASAGAQDYQVAQDAPSAPPPGYRYQAPPPGYRQPQPQPQPRQRYQPEPYGYERGYDDRRPRYGYDEQPYRPRGRRFGDYCATSRGACQTQPLPVGSACRCDIDGMIKRGIIQ